MFDFRSVETPYPGLRPFEAYESEIFFGREGQTERLLEILQTHHFVAIVGPSGCGKSSLVRAGLLPGLATGAIGTGGSWRVAVLRPGNRPMLALSQALLSRSALGQELIGRELSQETTDEFSPSVALTAAELRQGIRGLLNLKQAASNKLPANSAPLNLLILVDQFEELFSYATSGGIEADEAGAFVSLLLFASQQEASGIYFALTMRTEFLGDCVRFSNLPDAINRSLYLTPRLNREQMESAIRNPASVFGGLVDANLATELINGVGQDSDQLPILQHAMARMWRDAKRSTGAVPTLADSAASAVAGVSRALDEHANEIMGTFSAEQRALAETIFRAITERRETDAGIQDLRRPQTLSAIAAWGGVAPESLKPIVRAFGAPEVSFLRHGGELDEKSVIDLSHEALIRQWAELKAWVVSEYARGAEYRRWSKRALDHQGGKSELLSGADLAQALKWWNPEIPNPDWRPTAEWAGRYSNLVHTAAVAEEVARTRQFILDSRRTRARREARRRITVGITALFLVTFGTLFFALWQNARESEKVANIARREAASERDAARESQQRALQKQAEAESQARRADVESLRAQEEGKRASAAAEKTINEVISTSWKAGAYLVDACTARNACLREISGVHPIYDRFSNIIDLDKLQALLPMDIYSSSSNANDFSHYNKEFVNWAIDHAIPAAQDDVLKELTQPVYDTYLREIARFYFLAYYYAKRDPVWLRSVVQSYGSSLDYCRAHGESADQCERDPGQELRGHFDSYSERVQSDKHNGKFAWAKSGLESYFSSVGGGFWIRREIDGTADSFFELLKKLLVTYDSAWLRSPECSSHAAKSVAGLCTRRK